MPRVQVMGRDAIAEAYRIETDAGRALVPECLMGGLRPCGRPSHQEAYEWIAAHRAPLARAVATLAGGETPRKPYDILSLIDRTAPSSCP
ncbi:hypothetical protein [Thetidibacter halocola]|uniref:Uncharacterized protein n=1 Tax=Thetidibacter halocola TaxID=2827239 RepID=A0A8J7WFT4_9RHOB|nr:hypothetical protein [Thetidibacter halocola]MBS0124258.1 hypothetical protein [Thetidibacter halocola]